MRTVSRLSIAPVKSMALVHPDQIDLQRWGAVGNRVFCWVGPEGRLIGGAQQGTLVRVRACHEAETEVLTLTFPDGTAVSGSGADLGEPMLIDIWGRAASAHVVRGPFAAPCRRSEPAAAARPAGRAGNGRRPPASVL